MVRDNYWTGIFAKRISRRNVLRGVAVSGLGLAAAATLGCGEEEQRARTPSGATGTAPAVQTTGTATPSMTRHNTGYTADQLKAMSLEERREAFHAKYLKELWQGKQPKYGGVYKVADVTTNVTTWDVTKPAGAATLALQTPYWNQLLSYEIGDLYENTNFHILELDLAESYEQPDDLTYVFKIPKGVKYHDLPPANGRELTAEDVRYVLETYSKAPAQSATYADVDVIEAVDATTIRLKMKMPASYFLISLTEPFHNIFPPEQHESGTLDKGPVGTGAFILESYDGEIGATARKNPNYFKTDRHTKMKLPYIDRVEALIFRDPARKIAAFRTGQVDRVRLSPFEEWFDLTKTNPEAVYNIIAPPPSAQTHIGMQLGKEPFNDVRVRRALSLALDRDAMIGLLSDMGEYAFGLTWDYFGYEWGWPKDQLGQWSVYSPDRAKQLMQEAGYGSGVSGIELISRTPVPAIVLAAVDMWKAIGVNVEVRTMEQGEFFELWYNAKYKDMAAHGLIGPSAEPDFYVFHATHSTSPKNYYTIKDAKNDELAEKQRRILDVEERKKVLREWMTYQLDQMYRIWLVVQYGMSARQPNVYNATDQLNAFEPGWGAKVRELVWKDS